MRSSATAVLRGASAATSRRCTRPYIANSNINNSIVAATAAPFTTGSRLTSSNTKNHSYNPKSTPTTTQCRPFSQQIPQPLRADTSEQAATAGTSTSASSPPPETTRTHYDLFPSTLPLGPPPSGHFPIDTRALRREFLRLQARAHPDMHPPGAAKARAEGLSALINEAYRTLANPLLRAQYLLALRGVDVANDERLKVDEPELLMVVLEAREEIEDAGSEEELQGIREENEERIARGEEALERAFREDDVESAKREAVRMRYWVNVRESLDNWEPGKPIVLEH